MNLVGSDEAIFEEENLIRFIDDGHVVYIGRSFYDSYGYYYSGHASLVYGYTKEIINGSEIIKFLLRNPSPKHPPNPWNGMVDTVGHTQILSYEAICNNQITGGYGVWEAHAVVSMPYSTQTIPPDYN